MTPLFIYYLKATIALALFYAFYRLMFDRDTFFGWKRTLLMGSIALSAVYPFIDISSWLEHNEPVKIAVTYYVNTLPEFVVNAPQQNKWWNIPDLATAVWLIYLAGIIIATIRLLIQLSSILNLRRKGHITSIHGIQVIALTEQIAPFSFFQWIFINPEQHTSHELNEILAHEQTHVREWHSIDVIFSQLTCIVFWFNPFSWFTQRAIRQNLEYLADHRVIHSGYDSKGYQYHLLRLTHHTAAANLGNNFNVSELKKRIVMMNKQKSPSLFLTKYMLVIPLATVLVITNHAEALAKKVEKMTPLIIPQPTNNPIVINDQPEHSSLLLKKETPKETLLASVSKENKAQVTELQSAKSVTIDDEPFTVVEQMPQYPGGQDAMFKFLAQNLRYPVKAQQNGVQGMVILSFIVTKTGQINSIKIVRGVDPELDNEAMRVVKTMPIWIPGKQKGENVNVKYTLPVRFALGGGTKEETPAGGVNVIGYGNASKTNDFKWVTPKPGEKAPLIIIDGKESTNEEMKVLDANKIKEVSVLKDDAATKTYGEKGKNGVIIITLKKE